MKFIAKPTIELPKINLPTFNGDILYLVPFWEQFKVAIHSDKELHDVQKLAYFRDAAKAGPAKHIIKGLLHSAIAMNRPLNVYCKVTTNQGLSTKAT